MTPINVATNTAGAPITIPLGVSGVTVSPDGATLYVTGDPNITPVNLATNTVGASFVNVGNPTGTAITPNGSKLLTSNRNNFVTVQDTATHVRTTDFVLNARAGDVAITPNGATALRRVHGARGRRRRTDRHRHRQPGREDQDRPGGPRHHDHARRQDRDRHEPLRPQRHARVDGDEHRGATIQVGTNPFAVAVTPDQAPVARLHVARAPLGQAATLDASASTTPLGTRTAYVWDFGDGAKALTLSPITQHIYNEATDTASVTVINSASTSTTRTFTGRTVSNNGDASATAFVLASLAGSGPVVNAVLPAAGATGGGTT